MEFLIGNVKVTFVGITDATENEARNYIQHVKEVTRPDAEIIDITVTATPDGLVDVEYKIQEQRFERIRRITGYLSGDITSWNDAKRNEERDRVKHANFDKRVDLDVTFGIEDRFDQTGID